MDASTKEDFAAWGMMVGRQEGRFLELLVFATQATSILEIGTFTGYSAIAMAAGLGKDGSIISLEVDSRTTPRWPGATSPPLGSRATSVSLGAGVALPRGGRRGHSTSLHRRRQGHLRRLLRSGAAQAGPPRPIVVDNTLQGGGVLASESDPHEGARALRAFNDKVVNIPGSSAS